MLFFFWLPFYLQEELKYSNDISALLSTWFDVGGIIGGALAGSISDLLLRKANMDRSFVLLLMILISAGQLYLYFSYAGVGLPVNITLMITSGIMIGGPNYLMPSAVAADLNEHPNLKGNTEALATIAGVIDGTASVVAAVGQVTVAAISTNYGWNSVFIFLMASIAAGALMLTPMVYQALRNRQEKGSTTVDGALDSYGSHKNADSKF